MCVYRNDSIPCATTAADGTFTLSGLPLQTDLVITVVKDGYRSTMRPIETASTNMGGAGNAISLTPVTAPDPPVPVTVDWQNKGQLSVSTPFGQFGYPAPPTSVKFPIVAGYMTGPIGIFCTAK